MSHKGWEQSLSPPPAIAALYWPTGAAALSSGWWWRLPPLPPPLRSPVSSSTGKIRQRDVRVCLKNIYKHRPFPPSLHVWLWITILLHQTEVARYTAQQHRLKPMLYKQGINRSCFLNERGVCTKQFVVVGCCHHSFFLQLSNTEWCKQRWSFIRTQSDITSTCSRIHVHYRTLQWASQALDPDSQATSV